MSNTLKHVLIALLAGLPLVCTELLKAEPTWTWLATIAAMATAFAGARYVTSARSDQKLGEANKTIDKLAARVGESTLPCIAILIGCIAAGAALGVAGVAVEGCTPAQRAEIQAVEKVVLDDLAAGKTREQIVGDVCNALGGTNGVCTAATDGLIVLDDALALLIDAGVDIPAWLLGRARTMAAEVHPIALGHRAGR